MIFHLDSSVVDKTYAHDLASYLKLIHEKRHKIDYDSPSVWDFIEQEVLSTAYLGKVDIDLIKENKELREVNKTDRDYFRTVIIGTKPGMTDLATLGIILKTNSCVVLENSHHDWWPIKIWIDFVKNDREFKEINQKVSEAIALKWIYPEHAGGGDGTIKNKILDIEQSTYSSATKLKVTTIFDSDKVSATIPSQKNKGLKEFLMNNGFEYHEWERREIENYIPLRIYKNCNLCQRNQAEPDTTPVVWNYTDIGKHPYFNGKYTKDKLPMLAQNIDKSSVKESFASKTFPNKVDNHLVSELQYVIFLLAKYI